MSGRPANVPKDAFAAEVGSKDAVAPAARSGGTPSSGRRHGGGRWSPERVARTLLARIGAFLGRHRPTAALARRFSRPPGAPLVALLYREDPFGGALPGRLTRTTAVFVLAAAGVVAGAVALRAWHQLSAYELFMDEVQYADVANSFADRRGPELFREPFFLHPPLTFFYLSRFVDVPLGQVTVGFVLSLRPALLVFGAANTALVVAAARRVVPRWAALVVGVVYALDPFVLRFDSRLMLESPMLFGVLAGLLALLCAAEARGGRRRALLAVAGLAFGLALTTKTNAALVTALPLLIMLATSWGLRRREAAGVLGCEVGVYGVYVAWTAAIGELGDWAEQTFGGVLRALGVVKETGFTSGNAPSFTGRLAANLGLFAPSYLLVGVASGVAAYLVVMGWRSLRVGPDDPRRFSTGTSPNGRAPRRVGSRPLAILASPPGRRGPLRRSVGGGGPPRPAAGPGDHAVGLLLCWLAGVLCAIVYTVGFGELEEQTFYLLAVPSTLVVGLLLTRAARLGWIARTAVVLAVVVALAASGAVWWTVRSAPDDTYARYATWLRATVPPGSAQIALGEQTAQFVMPGYGVHKLTTVADAVDCGCRYGLVSTQLSALGLAPASTALVDELRRRYATVFSAHGRTAGDLIVVDLSRPLDGTPPIGAPR